MHNPSGCDPGGIFDGSRLSSSPVIAHQSTDWCGNPFFPCLSLRGGQSTTWQSVLFGEVSRRKRGNGLRRPTFLLLRSPKFRSGIKAAEILTAATRSPRCICRRQRSDRSQQLEKWGKEPAGTKVPAPPSTLCPLHYATLSRAFAENFPITYHRRTLLSSAPLPLMPSMIGINLFF